jgi:precorrin-6B methylase 2
VGGSNVSLTCANGQLYLRSQKGQVALVDASPNRYSPKGLLEIPDGAAKLGSTAPVVAGGRRYLRDDDLLFCYDVKEGGAASTDRQPLAAPDPERSLPRTKESRGHDVFVPTPQDIVDKMLELAKVQRDDVVYDLGCGDGRIVVTAARKYGCKAIGYDIDTECVKLSRENVKKHDLGGLVTIEQKDLFTVDLANADVVALYLLPRTLERLLPQLRKLKPGARIVSHEFEIAGVRPDRVATYTSREDDHAHKVYLWTTPLKATDSKK